MQITKDPRYVQAANEKHPKYVSPEGQNKPFSDKGIYMVIEK